MVAERQLDLGRFLDFSSFADAKEAVLPALDEQKNAPLLTAGRFDVSIFQAELRLSGIHCGLFGPRFACVIRHF